MVYFDRLRHLINHLVYSKSWFYSLNQLPIKIGTFQFLRTGLHGLCFGFCFAGSLHLRSLTNGPLFRVCYGESLVVRLYSEIYHLHLSIEAQCVSHHLPLGDCHKGYLSLLRATWFSSHPQV